MSTNLIFGLALFFWCLFVYKTMNMTQTHFQPIRLVGTEKFAVSMGLPTRQELTREDFLVEIANHYITLVGCRLYDKSTDYHFSNIFKNYGWVYDLSHLETINEWRFDYVSGTWILAYRVRIFSLAPSLRNLFENMVNISNCNFSIRLSQIWIIA